MGKAARARAAASKTVALAYIHPGQISSYFTESLVATLFYDVGQEQLGHRPRRIRNVYQEWSSANVSGSRNLVTQRFLDRNDADWLLWIDADMQWDPRDVDVLLDTADPAERPIVGGLCFGYHLGRLIPTIYQFAEIDDQLTTVRVQEYPLDTVMRCAATGAAFLLIHRSVLQQMADREFNTAYPFFQETQNGDKPVGEDITFCLRAGILGFPIYVHTGVRVGHHKSSLLTEDMFLAEKQEGETNA